MDFKFEPEQEGFRGDLREFFKRELPPGWEGGEFENDNWDQELAMRKKLVQKGWLTMAWPEEYGGQGASHMMQLIFNEEMAYHRCPGRDPWGIRMLAPTLMIAGTEEQKRTWLPPIARGEVQWCQGYSEPESGSDLASLQCRAVEDGDDFVINGAKIWTSNAHHADHIFVLVRTDTEAPKHRGISFLLCDMSTPGLTVRPIINMAGVHGFNMVTFDDVRVPKENLVGEKNRGWYVAATLMDFERSGVDYSAQARRNLEELVEYAKETKHNGHTLSQDPLVRHRMADMFVETEVNRMISYDIAYMQSQGQVPNKEASIGKLLGTTLQQRVAATGVSLLGMYGQLRQGSKYERLHGRFAHLNMSSISATIAAGTSEIQRNIIATRGLGLPRD